MVTCNKCKNKELMMFLTTGVDGSYQRTRYVCFCGAIYLYDFLEERLEEVTKK